VADRDNARANRARGSGITRRGNPQRVTILPRSRRRVPRRTWRDFDERASDKRHCARGAGAAGRRGLAGAFPARGSDRAG